MIATILCKNLEQHTVTAFADFEGINDPDEQAQWIKSVLTTCPDNGACELGNAKLVSMMPLSKELRGAIGADRGPSGLIIGVKPSKAVWKAIANGHITDFDLDYDGDGVQISFHQNTSKRKESTAMSIMNPRRSTLINPRPKPAHGGRFSQPLEK
jgi:hypothetical protein